MAVDSTVYSVKQPDVKAFSPDGAPLDRKGVLPNIFETAISQNSPDDYKQSFSLMPQVDQDAKEGLVDKLNTEGQDLTPNTGIPTGSLADISPEKSMSHADKVGAQIGVAHEEVTKQGENLVKLVETEQAKAFDCIKEAAKDQGVDPDQALKDITGRGAIDPKSIAMNVGAVAVGGVAGATLVAADILGKEDKKLPIEKQKSILEAAKVEFNSKPPSQDMASDENANAKNTVMAANAAGPGRPDDKQLSSDQFEHLVKMKDPMKETPEGMALDNRKHELEYAQNSLESAKDRYAEKITDQKIEDALEKGTLTAKLDHSYTAIAAGDVTASAGMKVENGSEIAAFVDNDAKDKLQRANEDPEIRNEIAQNLEMQMSGMGQSV